MVTFLDVAHMVDAMAMMGVLGWGGGDGNVSWRCTHVLNTIVISLTVLAFWGVLNATYHLLRELETTIDKYVRDDDFDDDDDDNVKNK